MRKILILALIVIIGACTKKTVESNVNVLLLSASFTEVEEGDAVQIVEKDGNVFTYNLKEVKKEGMVYFFEFTSKTKNPLLTLSTITKDGIIKQEETLYLREFFINSK